MPRVPKDMLHLSSTYLKNSRNQVLSATGLPRLRSVGPLAKQSFFNLFAFLFPESCCLCARPLLWTEKTLCNSCLQSLGQRFPAQLRPLDGRALHVRFSYEGRAKEVLRRVKVQPSPRLLANLIRDWEAPDWGEASLVPVPSSRARSRERAFDPVLDLCKILGKKWGLHTRPCLARHPSLKSQKDLSATDRVDFLKDAFYLPKGVPPPKRLILVDDVITTGATLLRCAALLEAAGATCLGFVCLADTPSKRAGLTLFRPTTKLLSSCD